MGNKPITNAGVECYIMLKKTICFDHIEDRIYIRKQMNKIRKYQAMLPKKAGTRLEEFIRRIIYPIIYDTDYFSFLKRKEFGEYDAEEGSFVINSEESLDTMIYLLYERVIDINRQIDEFALKNLIA